MIHIEDYLKIGYFTKPHGVKGEITFIFTNDIFDRADCDYIVCLMDNIPVPFFIEEYRFKGNESAIFKLEGINNEKEAQTMAGREIYFPKEYIDLDEEEEYVWDYFIGFEIVDKQVGSLGKIHTVEDSTINVLFATTFQNEELLIPANEDLISEIDHTNKKIYMNIPEGLLQLQSNE